MLNNNNVNNKFIHDVNVVVVFRQLSTNNEFCSKLPSLIWLQICIRVRHYLLLIQKNNLYTMTKIVSSVYFRNVAYCHSMASAFTMVETWLWWTCMNLLSKFNSSLCKTLCIFKYRGHVLWEAHVVGLRAHLYYYTYMGNQVLK